MTRLISDYHRDLPISSFRQDQKGMKKSNLLIARLLQPASDFPSLSEIRITLLEPTARLRITLQPLMAIAIHSIGSVHHLLAQEVQLPNTDPTMMPTPPREPMSRPQEPRAESKGANNRQGDGGVVERLGCDRVDRWEAKDDGDEGDPDTRDDGKRFVSGAETEGSGFDGPFVDDAHGDGDAVGEVEADGGDGSRAVERDGGSEGREGEEERTAGAEEDGADW